MEIHPSAIIDSHAELGRDVTVGPYAVIGPQVTIGEGSVLGPHVIIEGKTTIGQRCRIHVGAALGGVPQDIKYRGGVPSVVMGDDNLIREYVTIHGSGDGRSTTIGNSNLLMAYSHVGHNCVIGNGVQMANYAGVSGHVVVEDQVVVGGMVGFHQFVRVGRLAMIGGYSKVAQDVPPFFTVDGRPAKPVSLNTVGLRRAGVPTEARDNLKRAFKLLYRSQLSLGHALDRIEAEIADSDYVSYLVAFLRQTRFGFAGRQLDTGPSHTAVGSEQDLSRAAAGEE